MQKLIIIIILVLSLIGFGVWWFFIREPQEAVYIEKDEETGKVEVFNLAPEFIKFKPLVVPVIHNGELVSNIGVIVVLEAKNEVNKEIIEENKQKIRNAFLRDMRLTVRNYTADHILNLNEVKNRFFKTSQRLLGEGIVDRVLIKSDLYLPAEQ